jgi:lipopolysaccharide transport system permease protein
MCAVLCALLIKKLIQKNMNSQQITIIDPTKKNLNYWKDLIKFRDLFYILSWRDVKVRYKQTVIGILWSFIRPLLTMIIFTVIFNKVAGLKTTGETPYALLVLCGLLPWQFFSTSIVNGSESLITNSNLLTKVYFPRIIVPVSSIITSLIEFGFSFIILFALMLYFRYPPSYKIIFLFVFVVILIIQSISFSIFFSALNVKYRDFRYVIPFLVQIGLYISPVGFSSGLISKKWQFLYHLNPIVSVIDGFRWCILSSEKNNPFNEYFLVSIILTILLLIYSTLVFRKMEKKFADII